MTRSAVRTLLGCWLLLAAASPAVAQNWTYASSDHFEVYTTGGDRRAREALTYFERIHAFFADVLRVAPRTTTPTRLIVFSNNRQFAPYSPSAVAAAYYLRGPDRDYIVMRSLDEESYPTVVHEYAHLILRASTYPLWLDEGLAEFFSTIKPDGDVMTVGTPLQDSLAYLTGGAALMDLDRLFAIRTDSPEYNTRSHAGVFYAQSWALAHMLLTDSRYRPGSERFLDAMTAGTPSAAAFQQVYGRTLPEVSRDLNTYIRRDDYGYYEAKYRTPAATARVPTRAVDPFEADLVTTVLLASQRGREDDARAAFDRLAAQKPDDLPLLESRAYFEMRSGDTPRAQPILLRAAELGSTNPTVYRDLAMLEPARAEEFLAKAFALSPDDFDVRLHYASLVLREGRSGQAVAILAPATRIPGERAFQFFQLLANAYVRLNEVEAGRAAALRAAEFAKPGDEADYAARLIRSIDEFVASRQAAAERAAARQAAVPQSVERPAERADAAVPQDPDAPAAIPSIAAAPFTPGAGSRGQPLIVTVQGHIASMECAGSSPVLEVATAGGRLRLAIDDPLRIQVIGLNSHTVDLSCGPQQTVRPMQIGYIPAIDEAHKTVGNVRVLDYRAP